MHDIRDILRLFELARFFLRIVYRSWILDEGQIELAEAGVEEPRICHALFEQSILSYCCHRLRVVNLFTKVKRLLIDNNYLANEELTESFINVYYKTSFLDLQRVLSGLRSKIITVIEAYQVYLSF